MVVKLKIERERKRVLSFRFGDYAPDKVDDFFQLRSLLFKKHIIIVIIFEF